MLILVDDDIWLIVGGSFFLKIIEKKGRHGERSTFLCVFGAPYVGAVRRTNFFDRFGG